MSIFDALNAQQRVPNAFEALQQIKNNPAAVLRLRGLDIPDGMNDPQQIVQHLISSGQISNNALQAAMQMMGRK